MRNVVLTLAVLAVLGLTGAAAVVGLGLFNVSARQGHLPAVAWVLHTTFRNAVQLRAPSMETAPDLTDPDLIALGAGHYATACVGCHAAPGAARTATTRAMVPEPPPIAEAVAGWQPNELHWIVHNGVKMSGMPAWPSGERADEVWAVVAWLTALQREEAPEVPRTDLSGAEFCATCHGRIGGRVPRLDIHGPEYLAAQLEAYASGRRPSGIMAQAVSLVPRDSHADLARQFGRSVTVTAPASDSEGARLARTGGEDVPACLSCHGEGRRGPPILGQNRAFIAQQLHLWRDGVLDHNRLMSAAAQELDDADIEALAAYLSGE